jgi:hypothetical protein
MTSPVTDKRKTKALTENIRLDIKDTAAWVIGSKGDKYVVSDNSEVGLSCSCPDFQHRNETCKHIHFYQMKVDNDRPVCPYGTDCYRGNLLHLREYSHPIGHTPKAKPDSK